jgi:hypothetical protein
MPPRYIVARRASGARSRHLSHRHLRRLESRFYRGLMLGGIGAMAVAWLLW